MNIAPILPPGPERVGDITCNPITNRKGNLAGHFARFVDRIDACGNYLGAQGVKISLHSVEADQLPAAVGSPVAAIKQEDLVLGVDTVRQIQRSAID